MSLPLSVALLVDCSASMDEKLPVAHEAGSRFIRTLLPEDLGHVVQFNDRIVMADLDQPVTGVFSRTSGWLLLLFVAEVCASMRGAKVP